VPAAAATGRGGSQADRDEHSTTGLAQPGRERAWPARHEPHLLEGGAGAFEAVPAQPPEELLYPVSDEHAADAGA